MGVLKSLSKPTKVGSCCSQRQLDLKAAAKAKAKLNSAGKNTSEQARKVATANAKAGVKPKKSSKAKSRKAPAKKASGCTVCK